jgi:hypothetical protein
MVLLGVLSALLIAGLLVGGMCVWLLAGRTFPRPRPRRPPRDGRGAQAAIRRHPAGRERWLEPDGLRVLGQPDGRGSEAPTGPDDDPEFISALERLIRGEDPGGLA